MILTCPACDTSFRVKEGTLGPAGRLVRCSACGHRWRALPKGEEAARTQPLPVPQTRSNLPALVPEQRNLPALRLRASREEMTPDRTERPRGILSGLPLRVPAWVLLAVALLALAGVLTLAWIEREGVVASVPAAAPLYGLFGAEIDPALAALSLQDVTLLRRRVEGEDLLIVEGWVRNGSSREVRLPALEARLLDQAGDPLHRWSFLPEQEVAAAGERVAFRTEAADRREAVSIDIDFLSDPTS